MGRINNKFLRGFRILEVSQAVAGPTVSQILADYGAEVIKVERPKDGDIFRNVPGMGATMFLAVNRGKKSIALDLGTKKGLEIFYDVVKISDVVVENLGPGVAEKLGLSFKKVSKTNPSCLYCKLESFGSGPYENVPAFDPVLQAASGIMSTTGFPPRMYARAGVSIVDMTTGMHAALGILAYLTSSGKMAGERRQRKGGMMRVSLFDAATYLMSYWIARYDLESKDTAPLGSTHIFGSPYNLFKTRNGHVYIAVASDDAWKSFCKALSFLDLLQLKRYSSSAGRVRRKQELEQEISRRLAKIETKALEAKLLGSGVPFGNFNTAKSLMEDALFTKRKILKKFEYQGRKFRETVNPVIYDGERLFAQGSPPKLGADTEHVLRSLLHYSSDDIEALKSRKIVS